MSCRPQAPQTPLGELIEAVIYMVALLGTLAMAVLDLVT
jgi:hypothetical protein